MEPNPPPKNASCDATAGSVARLADQLLDQLLSKQTQAWQSGQALLVEGLLSSEGFSCMHVDDLLSLVCNEVKLREEKGDKPTLNELQSRFPDFAEALQIQWEIDALLVSEGEDTFAVGSYGSTSISNREYPKLPLGDAVRLIRDFGRYEIISELGRGAFGVVYEAWDPKLKRRIALKRMRSGMDAGAEELRRMRTEAETIAHLRHPNIVQIFDVGEVDGLPFMAMEYCEGGSLAKRLDGTPMEPKLAAKFVREIASGVAAAHERRIIHRDLKPANVLLENKFDWKPKVADFGLAKQLDNDSNATATGNILGTPSYMAPEQAFGNAKEADARADVYSVGAILYECLTGRPPFRGTSIVDTLEQVRQREPAAIRLLEPRVPQDLETIAHKCLRKEPASRYPSIAELMEDLNRFLELKPILARRERWYQTTWRLAKRYPAVATLASISMGLLVTIAIASTIFASVL